MSRNEEKRPIIGGLVLIALGLAFGLNNIFHYGFLWQLILIAAGCGLLYLATTGKKNRGASFPGSFLIFLGLIFLADEFMWLPWGLNRDWPLFLIALGLAFLVSFLFQTNHKGLLIPSSILLFLGAIFMASEYHYMHWHEVADVLEWWPIVFLILGLYLIFLRPKNEHPYEEVNESKPE